MYDLQSQPNAWMEHVAPKQHLARSQIPMLSTNDQSAKYSGCNGDELRAIVMVSHTDVYKGSGRPQNTMPI